MISWWTAVVLRSEVRLHFYFEVEEEDPTGGLSWIIKWNKFTFELFIICRSSSWKYYDVFAIWDMSYLFWYFFITSPSRPKVVICVLQFGMLIEYLFEKFPNLDVVSDQAIGDLEVRKIWKLWLFLNCLCLLVSWHCYLRYAFPLYNLVMKFMESWCFWLNLNALLLGIL